MKTPSKLKAMGKARLKILTIALYGIFATTAAFSQTTFTWTGAANGTNLSTAGNWNPNGLPSGATQDTALWDGVTTSNLVISYNTTSLPSTGFGSSGIFLILSANQTNNVQLVSSAATSATVGVFAVTNNSSNATLTLGDNTANQFVVATRPGTAGTVHSYVNNSSSAAIINPSVQFLAGGGVACVLDFGGTGNWIINNNLRDNNSGAGPITVVWEGPGTMTWSAGGTFLASDALGPIGINGGTVILKSPGLALNFSAVAVGNNTITNDSTLLEYDGGAPDTIGRLILGTGPLLVNSGTLTLSSGASTYTGNVTIKGGELIVNGAETPGTSGPLGVSNTVSFTGGTLGFTVNNVFDYSSRFSTAASQTYSIDTGGQSVTFATALASSGGTLTKVGSGTLTLSGTSSFSGLTTVSVGKLVFQGSKTGSGNITVADSAALGVTDAGTQVTPGTLTLGTTSGATLEFNNVNNTATAPLAAGTLSSAGTVTININTGTLAPGQMYPLLTWTTGPAPAVSLGTLNGFIGNLSTNGNSIKLNITATAFKWTGLNNSSWDLSTPNNWVQNGGPVTFANGGPALFDDTAANITVTIGALVQPTSVTVNTVTNAYTITSSAGNDIGGNSSFTKSGSSTLTLSGGANTYTGATTISGGTLSTSTLANGGSASDIGQANNSAASLVLNGGTLQFTGAGGSSDHLFTLGTSGGAIDSSGSAALNLSNGGSVSYIGNGPRTFTLTGALVDTNTFAAKLADNGGATTLTKNGAGTWILTGANTHSGVTTIAGGTLQIGAGGGSGSPGTGNITDDATLDFNRTNSLTVSGTVTGTGSVINDGTGTTILPGNNNYAGTTTINNGTLQIGNGGSTGQLSATGGVTDNGTLTFNSTGALTLSGIIGGSGQLIKQGSGLLKLIGANTYTGATTVAAGAQLQVSQGNTGAIASSVITNNGTLFFVRQDTGVFVVAGNIVGTGKVVKDVNNPNAGDVTLTASNTYSGGTFIDGGAIIVGDGTVNGSIVGNVTFTNSPINDTAKTFTFNRSDDITFSGNILGNVVLGGPVVLANAGAVTQNGTGRVTLTGTNTYPAGTTITQGIVQVGAGGTSGTIGSGVVTDNGELDFNRSDNITFTNGITGAGSVVQLGSDILTLNSTNDTYTGATTVSNGTLVVVGSLGGELDVSGGTVAAGSTTAAATLAVGGNMNINSGTVLGVINKSSPTTNTLYSVGGTVTYTAGTLKLINEGPALTAGDKFTLFSQLVTGGATVTIVGPPGATVTNNLAVDGSVSVVTVAPRPTVTATILGGHLSLTWPAVWTGLHVQGQTNSLTSGLGTNWVTIPGTDAGHTFTTNIVATNKTAFYRLAP